MCGINSQYMGDYEMAGLKDDKTEENTFEILQHSDRNRNNS